MDRRPRVQFRDPLLSDNLDAVQPVTSQAKALGFSGVSVTAQYGLSRANTPHQDVADKPETAPAMRSRGDSNYRWYEIKPWARDLTPRMIRTYICKLSNKQSMQTEIGKLPDCDGEPQLVAVASLDSVHAELVRDRLTEHEWKIYREQKTALYDVNDHRQKEIDRAIEEWRNERLDVDRRKKERPSLRMFVPSSVRRR